MGQRFYDWREEPFKRTDDSSEVMKIDGSGAGAKTFRVAAPAGEEWLVTKIILFIQDGTGWHSARFAAFASALTNGVVLRKQRLAGPTTIWSFNMKRNNALFEKMQMEAAPVDFTNSETIVRLALTAENGTAFYVTDDDVLEILIQDDLTALTKMRAHVHLGVVP